MLLGAFIGIIASVIRLIFSALVNIIFMPRIDYTYLVEPLKGLGTVAEIVKIFIMNCLFRFGTSVVSGISTSGNTLYTSSVTR
jgi:hypothetical protein